MAHEQKDVALSGLAHQDGGVEHEDGGLVHKDGGVAHKDVAVAHNDRGVAHKDGGLVHKDGGVAHKDVAVAYKNGEVAHKDGGVAHKNGSMTHKNGSMAHNEGSVAHNDGGMAHKDGGVAHKNGSMAHKDGGEAHKDGGLAWLGLFAGTLATCLCSLTICTGVFHIVFLEEFGRDKSTTAWLGGLQTSLCYFAGIVPSLLSPYLADHWVMALGAFCASTGFFVCSFLESFWLVLLFYGVLSGLGFGTASTIGAVAMGSQFDKYRNAAFGIVSTGAGVGLMLFAPLLQLLLDNYTWRDTLRIVSAILLNLYACAALMHLVSRFNGQTATKMTTGKIELSQKDSSGAEMNIIIAEKQPLNPKHNRDTFDGEHEHSTHESSRLNPEGVYNKIMKTFRYSKLSSIPFVVFQLSLFLINTGMSATYLHFPAYISSIAGSFRTASILLTLIGVGNILGRLGFGFFTNKFKELLLPTFIFACLLTGVTTVLVPYICRFFLGQCVFSLIFASFGNCFLPLLGALSIRLVDLENLYMAYGIGSFSGGFGQLLGPVFAGWCYDVSGSYFYTFIFAGSCYLLASVAMAIATKLINQ